MIYAISVAVIVFFGIWGWRYQVANTKRILTLKSLADMGRTALAGKSVAEWLDVVNRDGSQTLLANSAGVMSILGHTVLLVDGQITYTTLGRFGAIGGRSLMLFLIAVDSEAVTSLKARSREFQWLSGTDNYAAFSIRRLDDVIALCKQT